MKKLSTEEIHHHLDELQDWKLEGSAIKKNWQFEDFRAAMKFINEVADLANRYDHHPELFNVYNKVSLKFSTHDAGGLTERDFKMAKEVDKIQ
ncbi:MAG: 4a-hydroxytetrahydrobiopterin dehydratase [Calditrichia bacterium]